MLRLGSGLNQPQRICAIDERCCFYLVLGHGLRACGFRAQLDPELFRCWVVCALVARRDGEHLTGYNLFHIHPQTIDGKAQRGSAQCMPSPMLPRIHVYP